MSRGGEDVYETSSHKKHVIPMVRINKEADWKAWRSGLSVAARFMGLPHVLMSIPVDRGNQDKVKAKPAAPRKKKVKARLTPSLARPPTGEAPQVQYKSPASPAKQPSRSRSSTSSSGSSSSSSGVSRSMKMEPVSEEIKIESPEPRYEAIEFPIIPEKSSKEAAAEIVEQYDTKVQQNQQKHHAEMKERYKKKEMDRLDQEVSDLENSDVELTEGFSPGYDAGDSEGTLTMDKEEARLFNPQMVFKSLITQQLKSGQEGVYRTEL